MVVSVVTREVSDDANAFVVTGRSVWLRVSRIDHVYAYHASADGMTWRLVRVFSLGKAVTDHQVGFEAQSPTGDGCTVTFAHISFTQQRLAETPRRLLTPVCDHVEGARRVPTYRVSNRRRRHREVHAADLRQY